MLLSTRGNRVAAFAAVGGAGVWNCFELFRTEVLRCVAGGVLSIRRIRGWVGAQGSDQLPDTAVRSRVLYICGL